MNLRWTNAIAVVVVALGSGTAAQVVTDTDPDLQRIDVVEHLGDKVPGKLRFVTHRGDSVMLDDFLNNCKPTVLVLGYYECPMLCNLVFNGLVDGFNDLDWSLGDQYQVVTVSINPAEGFELANAKRTNYLGEIVGPVSEPGWTFMVGDQSQSLALAEAVGFEYFYDTERQEYAHPAVAFVLTEDGTISRYLYGINFTKTDLKLALLEATEGKIGNTIDRLLLYCFHYDPDSRGYTVVAANVMKLGGGATLVVLAIFVSLLFYGERRRRRSGRLKQGPAAEVASRQ